jgi:hypothetical protein
MLYKHYIQTNKHTYINALLKTVTHYSKHEYIIYINTCNINSLQTNKQTNIHALIHITQ